MLGVSTLKYEYTPDGKKKKKRSKEKNAFMLQVHFRLVKFDVWFTQVYRRQMCTQNWACELKCM